MAEAAISSLVQLLTEVLTQKIKSLRGVEGQVESLKHELEMMQAFLIDANRKQYEDESVRKWISDIRELAQDAQDTMEMFVVNVENVGKEEILKRCINYPKCVQHLDRIGGEIRTIRDKLVAIKTTRDTYGIKDLQQAAVDSARILQVERRRRHLEQHPVGMDYDVEHLLRQSVFDENTKGHANRKGLSIAMVKGMGGIGKSTLARKIYTRHDVVAGFDCLAWVVVSSEFSPQETIKKLILDLPRSEEDKRRLRELEKSSIKDELYLQEKLNEILYKQLEGKQFFIVLDDVWELEHWEIIKNAFPDEQGKRSRLLITTRNNDMAKYCQFVLEMNKLDPDKSWELLLYKVFLTFDRKCPEVVEKTGRQILEKCDGLPLAISTVGGLLAGKQSKSEWEEILQQIDFHLGRGKTNVLSILELSYQNLSPQLKLCFLCLAYFKEDAYISVKRLLHIWFGQGLIEIQQEEGTSLSTTEKREKIARGYLDDLISRNLVQVKRSDLGHQVKYIHVHDLVREVCIKKAKEELGFKDGSSSSSSNKGRHLVTYNKNLESLTMEENKHLRSLFILDDVSADIKSSYWRRLPLLKILDLNDFKSRSLPPCFRALIGLKYLRIDAIQTLQIPRWLDHLQKLEVIEIIGTVELPNVELKMESLRFWSGNIVGGLISIDHWKKIEMFGSMVKVEDWMRSSRSKQMASCPVRELRINLDGWISLGLTGEKLGASFQNMVNLVTMRLRWSKQLSLLDLALTLPNLTKLVLHGEISKKFPAATIFFPNLSHIKLVDSCLVEDPMAQLGKLPNLIYLELLRKAYMGSWMHVLHDGFPCLKTISLQELYIKDIHVEEGGMPHLKHVQIKNCTNISLAESDFLGRGGCSYTIYGSLNH